MDTLYIKSLKYNSKLSEIKWNVYNFPFFVLFIKLQFLKFNYAYCEKWAHVYKKGEKMYSKRVSNRHLQCVNSRKTLPLPKKMLIDGQNFNFFKSKEKKLRIAWRRVTPAVAFSPYVLSVRRTPKNNAGDIFSIYIAQKFKDCGKNTNTFS